MTVLVDTDMVSELHRNRNAVVRQRASDYRAKHGAPAISCMTVFEIVFGWQRVKRPLARSAPWGRNFRHSRQPGSREH